MRYRPDGGLHDRDRDPKYDPMMNLGEACVALIVIIVIVSFAVGGVR